MKTMTEEEEISYATEENRIIEEKRREEKRREEKRREDSEGILSYMTSFFLPSASTVETKSSSVTYINYKKDIQNNYLREYWSRGDGFCALHSLMQSYLINGNSFLVNGKGDDIKNILSLRKYLLDEVIPSVAEKYGKHFKRTVSIPELISQLDDDGTTIIVSEFVHQLMSDLLNSQITVYNTDEKTKLAETEKIIYYPNTHIFGGLKAQGEIFVKTNGIHYNSLIPANTNFNTKKDALEWRLTMMKEGNGERLPEEFIKERMVNLWNL